MSFREGLLNIEKRWAWSFFGFLLAIIFGGIAVYTAYFQDQNPHLEYIIEGKTPVLDLREDIKNLDILYKGINIKEQDKNLSVITLKVINNSDVNILKGFYDDLSPLRISVQKGDIVDKPQVIATSNEYLKEHAKVGLDDEGYVHFPKLILEGHESYSISLLILHKNGIEPLIKGDGKIGGQVNSIPVITNYSQKSDLNFWDKLLIGSIWVHIVRFLGYIVGFVILGLAIVLPTALISEFLSEQRKKKRVKKYKTKKEIENSLETDAVFDLYLRYSLEFLVRMQKLLKSETRLKEILRRIERRMKRENDLDINSERRELEIFRSDELINSSEALIKYRLHTSEFAARELKRVEMVRLESNEVIINEKFAKELADFISYLKLI